MDAMQILGTVLVVGLILFALFRQVTTNLTKQCPSCAQRIKDKAAVCPFCSYRFVGVPKPRN